MVENVISSHTSRNTLSHNRRYSSVGVSMTSGLSKILSFVKNNSSEQYLSSNEKQNLQSVLEQCNEELSRTILENEVFEKFIARVVVQQQHQPSIQPPLPQVTADTRGSRTGIPLPKSASISVKDGASITAISSHAGRSTMRYGLQIKINVPMRIEMVMHEMEDLKIGLEQYQNERKAVKFKYRIEIEEKTLSLKDIRARRAMLQQNIAGDGTADTMVKMTAERYLRYIHDILKNCDHLMVKMKLKLTKMRVQHTRLTQQLEQKMELGETIQPIDFEELKIENKDYAKELEEKNKFLLGLKRVTGYSSQNLNATKRNLDELMERLQGVSNQIEHKEKVTTKLMSDEIKTRHEITKAMAEYKSIHSTVTNYKAPSIMDYAKKKAEERELVKNIKMWNRRLNLQDNTITLLKHQLKTVSTVDKKHSLLPLEPSLTVLNAEESDDEESKEVKHEVLISSKKSK